MVGHAQNAYNRIVDEFVAPRLAVHGFKMSGGRGVFARWPEKDVFWQITCSFRKVRGRDEGWLSIFVCVGFRSLVEFLTSCNGVVPPTRTRPCIMAANLGTLGPAGKFLEWRLLPDTDVRATALEIIREISRTGLDYFEQYGKLPQALAAWENGVTYNLGGAASFYRAASYWLSGDQQKALSFVDELKRRAREELENSGRQSDAIWLRWVEAFADSLRRRAAGDSTAERGS